MASRTPFAIGQYFVEYGATAGTLVRPLQVTDIGQDILGLDRVTFRRADGSELDIWTEQAELAVSVGHLIPVPSAARPNPVAA
jgi:hypothetical protein